MFIRVTRRGLENQKTFVTLLPVSAISYVCSGYEQGSRLRMAGALDEIEVAESPDEIWRMMKDWR